MHKIKHFKAVEIYGFFVVCCRPCYGTSMYASTRLTCCLLPSLLHDYIIMYIVPYSVNNRRYKACNADVMILYYDF